MGTPPLTPSVARLWAPVALARGLGRRNLLSLSLRGLQVWRGEERSTQRLRSLPCMGCRCRHITASAPRVR